LPTPALIQENNNLFLAAYRVLCRMTRQGRRGEEAAAKERYVMFKHRTSALLAQAVVNPNQSHWIP